MICKSQTHILLKELHLKILKVKKNNKINSFLGKIGTFEFEGSETTCKSKHPRPT